MDNMTILTVLHIIAIVVAFAILVAVRSNKEHIGLLEALIAVLQDKMDMHQDSTDNPEQTKPILK